MHRSPDAAEADGRFWPAAPVWAIPVMLAGFAAATVLFATGHGLDVSPDSASYLAAARNLLAGRGFTDFTLQPLTTFPPGLPGALASLHILGASFVTGWRLVNAASFAAIVVLSWSLLRRHVGTSRLAVGGTACVAISPALLDISDRMWSEPLFVAIVLAFIVVLESALKREEKQTGLLVLAGSLAGSACLVRYAGLSLVLVGAIAIALRRAAVGRVVARSAAFLAAAALFPLLWLIRNATSGAQFLTGPRVSAPGGLDILTRFFLSSFSLLLPGDPPVLPGIEAAILATLVLLAWKSRAPDHWMSGQEPRRVLVVFVVVYSIVVLTASKVGGSSMDARILSPLYVPMFVLVVGLLKRAVVRNPDRLAAPHSRIGLALAVAYLGCTGAWFAYQAGTEAGQPQALAGERVALSPIVAAIPAIGDSVRAPVIASNRPYVVYFVANTQPIIPSPGRLFPELDLAPGTAAELGAISCARPVYLIWFTHSHRPWAYRPAQLASEIDLHRITDTPEAVLYRVHARHRACSVKAHRARAASRRTRRQ